MEKDYICYYNCPKCNNPFCGSDPLEIANEMVTASNKAEARQFFNQCKMCRNMKIVRIEEDANEATFTITIVK